MSTADVVRSLPWRLPFYCFLLNLTTGGLVRSNSLIFVALMDENQIGRGAASWPFSLNGAAGIFVAPAIGFLSARLSPQQISSCGVFLYTISLIACYFSLNIYVVSIFYGVLRGCAGPMLQISRSVVLSNYFTDHRATAMGISSTGNSVAGFLWPPLIQYFLNEYTLRGTFLMLAGLVLHGFIGSIGLISFKTTNKNVSKKTRNACKDTNDERRPLLQEPSPCYETVDTFKHFNKREDVEKADLSSTFLPRESAKQESAKPMNSQPESKDRSSNEKADSKKPKVFNIQVLKKIFTCRGFYILVLNQIVIINTAAVFMQTLIDYLGDKGIAASDGLFMITAYSAGDLVGKLGLGWISDRKLISRQNHTALTTFSTSSAILLLTFSHNYLLLLACGFLVGIFMGSTLSVSNAQVADYLDRDELALAFAFRRSFNGIFAISRAPIIGYFRDELGTYDHLFWILCGGLYFISLVWVTEGIRMSRKKKSELERSTPDAL